MFKAFCFTIRTLCLRNTEFACGFLGTYHIFVSMLSNTEIAAALTCVFVCFNC
jgi:hypothetical protein